MGRKSLKDRNIRKLTRTGRGKSISVTLPIEYIRELRWKDRQKVVIKKRGKTLTIIDWKPPVRKTSPKTKESKPKNQIQKQRRKNKK